MNKKTLSAVAAGVVALFLALALAFAGGLDGICRALGGRGALAFADQAEATDAIGREIVKNEDPALMEELLSMPQFAGELTEYSKGLLEWRFAGGAEYAGMSRDVAYSCALSLLRENVDYSELSEDEFILAAQPAAEELADDLAKLLPKYEVSMGGTLLRSRLDMLQSIVGGAWTVVFAAIAALLTIPVIFLGGKKYAFWLMSGASALSALLCVIFKIAFARSGLAAIVSGENEWLAPFADTVREAGVSSMPALTLLGAAMVFAGLALVFGKMHPSPRILSKEVAAPEPDAGSPAADDGEFSFDVPEWTPGEKENANDDEAYIESLFK